MSRSMLRSIKSIIAASAIAASATIASAEDDHDLPMNGLFYGVDGPMDANAQQQYYYRAPAAWRFQAEMTGEILAISWDNRYNKSNEAGANYSKGTGGSILVEIRKDTGLKHPPFSSGAHVMDPLTSSDPNLLGKTANRSSPKSLGGIATLSFLKPVSVVSGRRYWVVFNQLQRGEYISVNTAHVKAPIRSNLDGPGGPYWGDDPSVAYASGTNWLYQAGTQRRESRHLPKIQFLYRLKSGEKIWSGFGSVYSQPSTGPKGAMRAFSDVNPVRMRFTPSQPTFRTRKLYLRAYVHASDPKPSDIKIEVWRGTTLLGSWTAPAKLFPVTRISDEQTISKPPTLSSVPFTAINLGREITIQKGAEHFLRLSCASGKYSINAQQQRAVVDGVQWANRNSFLDGWAEYSTNRGTTWRGWHISNRDNRRDLALPFMFEIVR